MPDGFTGARRTLERPLPPEHGAVRAVGEFGNQPDLETIFLAIEAASTGHLVLATLHTQNASKTVDQIIDIFPASQQGQIRATLADSLKAVVAQTLFKHTDVKGRCAALEILMVTPAVSNLIREAKTLQIPGVIQTGKKYGMQTLEDSMMEYLKKKGNGSTTPHPTT